MQRRRGRARDVRARTRLGRGSRIDAFSFRVRVDGCTINVDDTDGARRRHRAPLPHDDARFVGRVKGCMAFVAPIEKDELVATLLAYERVFTACWPEVHAKLEQRRAK